MLCFSDIVDGSQPQLSDVFGSAATGYTSAMVAVAAMSAAVAAAMLAVVVILIIRYWQKKHKSAAIGKPSRFFGSISSMGFTTIASRYSNESDDIDDSQAVAAVS